MIQLGIGCLIVTASLAFYDLKRYLQLRKLNSDKSKDKLIKICLTGGPCGGKSSGINTIYNAFKKISAPFFVVPEAATIIGTSGLSLDLSRLPGRSIELFQIYLMTLQYNLQQAIFAIAASLGSVSKRPVILCDRGLLDGKAYAGPQNFAKMLREVNITQEQINSRYQAIVHMVTAAAGAPSYYKGNNVRQEDVQSAILLDEKLRKCYSNHHSVHVISNDFYVKNFEDKKVILLAQIYQILQSIIRENNLEEYYKVYDKIRKESADENEEIASYVLRKRKLQKYKNANRQIRGFESQ